LRKTISIISILLICSCKGPKKDAVRISNEFKLEFLNEILSDTTELKILVSKKQLISNAGSGYMTPPFLPTDVKNLKNSISYTKFISDTLNIKDTIFVKQQRIDNAELDLNKLEDFGFKIFDLKSLLKRETPYNSIIELADSLNIGTNNYSYVKFSIPIFNKEKNLAYMRISQGSSGAALILEKENGKWKRKYEIYNWVE
jgi:hypothetical protein